MAIKSGNYLPGNHLRSGAPPIGLPSSPGSPKAEAPGVKGGAGGSRQAKVLTPQSAGKPTGYISYRQTGGEDATTRYLRKTMGAGRSRAAEPPRALVSFVCKGNAGPVLLEASPQSPVGGTPHGAEVKPLTTIERQEKCANLAKTIEVAHSNDTLSSRVTKFCQSLRPQPLDKALIKDLFHKICSLRGRLNSIYRTNISGALAGLVEGMGGAHMDRERADLLVTLLRSGPIEPDERMYVVNRIAQSTSQVGAHCELHRAIVGHPRGNGGLYRPYSLSQMFSWGLGDARKVYDATFSDLNGLRQNNIRSDSDRRVKGGAVSSLSQHWSGLLQGEPKTAREIRKETRKLVADLLKKDPKLEPRDIMQAAINRFSAGDSELKKTQEGLTRLAITMEAMTAGLSDVLGFDTVAAYAVQAAARVPGGDVGDTPRWLSATFAGLGSVSPKGGDAAKGAGGAAVKGQPAKTPTTMAHQRPGQWAEMRSETIAAPRLRQIEAAFTRGQSYRT